MTTRSLSAYTVSYACRLCSDVAFTHSALATSDVDTNSASTTESSPSSNTPSGTRSPHVPPAWRLCADAHTCDQSHLHNRHSLDSVVVGDGCQCNGVERRWDDWHKGWPERANCSNGSVMVRLPDQHDSFGFQTSSCHCLSVRIDQLDNLEADAPLNPCAYIYLLGV